MKCDVCGKNVPIGTKECPNCGHKMDASQSQATTNQKSSKFFLRNKKALFLFIVIFMGIVVYGLFVSEVMPIKHAPLDYITRLTYQETIDKGYDDGSIEVAKGIEKDVETFVHNELQLSNIEINEYCLSDGRTTTTIFNVIGESENIKYEFAYSFYNQKLSRTSININGTSQENIQGLSQLPINEDLTNKMGDYLKISDAYSLLNEARIKMKQDEEQQKRMFSSNHDNPNISVLQIQESEKEYSFSCSIDIDTSKK